MSGEADERPWEKYMGGKGSGGHNRRHLPRPLSDDRELWERQRGETHKAYAAFQAYAGLDPQGRSVRRAAQVAGKSWSWFSKYCSRWSWVKRANAWDDRKERERYQAQLDEIRDMQRRHIKLSEAMQVVGGRVVADLAKKLQAGEKVKIGASEARQLIEAGVKMERLNRGQPTDVTEQRSVNMEELTDEQLDRLARGESPESVLRG